MFSVTSAPGQRRKGLGQARKHPSVKSLGRADCSTYAAPVSSAPGFGYPSHMLRVRTEQYTDVIQQYAYTGVGLMPTAIRSLILELFSGQTAKRDAIAARVRETHLARGGLDSSAADYLRSVKKALAELKKRGLADNPAYGTWRISHGEQQSEADTDPETATLDQRETAEDATITADFELGTGASAVYLYYYENYKQRALAEGRSTWPCKVGRTDRDPLGRVLAQAATALPEYPHLGLIFMTDTPGVWETAIHSVLRLRGRALDEAPGTEWFETTPEELIEILNWICPS